MPVTVAEVNALYGHYTAAMVAPLPPSPLTKEPALAMLQVSTQVAECFVGSNPIFPSSPEGGLTQVDHWATELLQLDEQIRTRINGLRQTHAPFRARDEPRFINRYVGEYHNSRPYVQIMMAAEPVERMKRYCNRVCNAMLQASSSISAISVLLFVCMRDWDTLDAWQRGKWIHHEAERRGVAIRDDAIPHSLGHLASLTSRQSRRSRVPQNELRARWNGA
ncbi:hypothetical protein BCR35DRAFT_332654 [Leucosporidium creatinivorum]|uniref:Uncharacterized protein n=1 Tax=Leucosporidium creatinivorum TaxID=106004 RepID=A0A1Y2F1Q0_9BASI|nr:hypothetical protein BCR35DRAFT_332654 [Leucosporidium creatinivorum]